MKILLKALAISGCILFLIGSTVLVTAQTSLPGVEGYPSQFGYGEFPGTPGGFGAPPPGAFERTSPAWKKKIKEVDFEGIPMSEIIAWLRGEFPEVNFISAPEVEEIYVKLKLRSVTLDDIFLAMNITSKGELIATPLNETMVSFHFHPLVAQQAKEKKISRAFSLADYLSGRSPEETTKALSDLENALEISWKMLKEANNDRDFQLPDLNLHAPTKMLIAVGDREQLQVIEGFISQLERRTSAPMYFAPSPQSFTPPQRTIPAPPVRIPTSNVPSTNKPPSTK